MAESNEQLQNRDAIIFIPGLSMQVEGSFESIIGIFKNGLDFNATTRIAKFEVNNALREEDFGGENTTRISTISRSVTGQSPPTDVVDEIDIYQMNYQNLLTDNFVSSNRVIKILKLIRLIILGFLNVVNAIGFLPLANSIRSIGRALLKDRAKDFTERHLQENEAKAKTFLEKIQLLFGVFLLALFIAYLIILIYAGIGTAGQIQTLFIASDETAVVDSDAASNEDSDADNRVLISQTIVIVIALINMIVPRLRQALMSVMDSFPSAIEFLSPSSLTRNKAAIVREFGQLLEYVGEKGYDRIHIVAYSFGSIIAIDTFFPQGGPPSNHFGYVHTLVTIGCPFDLIRLFWPNYFQKRMAIKSTLEQEKAAPYCWINVYIPSDIFGSNFKNSAQTGNAKKGIPYRLQEQSTAVPDSDNAEFSQRIPDKNFHAGSDISAFSYFMIGGFIVHSKYWFKGTDLVGNWRNNVINAMYQDQYLLS